MERDLDAENTIMELRRSNMTWSDIARYLNIDRRRLFRMRYYLPEEATLDNEDLVEEMMIIKNENPHFGAEYVRAALLKRGYKVQRERVREVMREIDTEGVLERRNPKLRIERRKYSVPGSNFLWHLDGNEKLQMFLIYLHGCVDGHSRKVLYMKCAGDKKAPTSFRFFYDVVLTYGIPRFIRMDRGGENVRIEDFMELNSRTYGHQRSVLIGPSVHNVRIERMWREINDITLPFKHLFYSMEIAGILNVNNPIELFALHFTYLPRIQVALDDFVQMWNIHGIRTANFRSPDSIFMTQQYGPPNPVVHAAEFEQEVEEERIQAERSQFALSIIPNPLFDDGNSGINLYSTLVNAINHLP